MTANDSPIAIENGKGKGREEKQTGKAEKFSPHLRVAGMDDYPMADLHLMSLAIENNTKNNTKRFAPCDAHVAENKISSHTNTNRTIIYLAFL